MPKTPFAAPHLEVGAGGVDDQNIEEEQTHK